MKLKFNVTGMTCAACSARVEKVANAVAGVDHAEVNLLAGTMMVDTQLTPERLQKMVFPHPTVAEIIREAIFH